MICICCSCSGCSIDWKPGKDVTKATVKVVYFLSFSNNINLLPPFPRQHWAKVGICKSKKERKYAFDEESGQEKRKTIYNGHEKKKNWGGVIFV